MSEIPSNRELKSKTGEQLLEILQELSPEEHLEFSRMKPDITGETEKDRKAVKLYNDWLIRVITSERSRKTDLFNQTS